MEQIGRTAPQIGAIVRRRRRQHGLTQAQLGARIGLRQATVSKLEAGQPATQLRTLLDALAALDLEIVVRPRTKASPNEIEELF
ncbi:MAG: helix-turn-helix domain-containing protein [Geminicoccaceae bacterium]